WFRGRYDLQLDNRGNHEQTYTLAGQDDEGAFVYRFDAEPVSVRAGVRRRVQLRAGLRLMRLFGQPKTYPFNIVGVPLDNSAPMQVVQGRLVQRPPIAPWMLRVLAVLLLLGLVAGCALLAWPWVPVARAYLFPQPTPTALLPTPAQPTALLPTLVPTPNAAATEQVLQGQQQATQGALDIALNQTATAAGQANSQTQTAVAGNIAQTQTAVTNNLAQTQTAVANAIGQTQTAIVSAVNASATAQALSGQTATASAQAAQTAVAATQTASVVSITQTALAALNITPTLTPTALPGSALDQSIVFNQVGGVPVSGRLPLRGDEYVRQDALFCFFRPVADSGLGRVAPPEQAIAHYAGLHAAAPPDIVAGPPARPARQQALELLVQDAIITEGNDGRSMAVFPLTLNVPDSASVTVTIRYSTRDGTALAGQDYVATTNTITLTLNNDGPVDLQDVLLQQIRVPIIGDTMFEPDETFVLNLELVSNPNDVALVRSQATGLIVNDDATPTPT
ncbi:MAG TPA: Calx-beta domain-containing protein, partial [Roseiflexaceae bacterium]|nr:Calx-beta domain-containing protein [Roseiflexaceae bacterium]